MSAPVIKDGVWHAPIYGAMLPCASEEIARSVLEVHEKNSPFFGHECVEEPAAPVPPDTESETKKTAHYG